jgi:DNA-binding NarL/FixJ family response regulator
MTTVEERREALLAEVSGGRKPRLTQRSEPAGGWVRKAACSGRPTLFDDPERTGEALAICAGCPVLRDCYAWALRNAVDGVAGGMSAAARGAWREANNVREPVVSVDDFLPIEVVATDEQHRLPSSEAVLTAVAQWTEKGETARAIGTRLGVTRRSVNRYRSKCRARSLIA